MDGFESTESPPLGSDRRIAQKCFEQLLVVAFQPDVLGGERIAYQPVEHASRIGTSVHVVAERYGQGVRRRFRFDISLDFFYDSVEQVRAAMDIADDVDPGIVLGVCQILPAVL